METFSKNFRERLPKKFGRSLWKEPDVLRKLAGYRNTDSNHKTPVPGNENVTDDVFPRILLGGPIVFHSSKEKALCEEIHPLQKDGSNGTKEADRMASPVITRPVYNKGEWYAGITVLYSPEQVLEQLVGVKIKDKQDTFDKTAIQNKQLISMRAFQGCPADNAIDAFCQYAKNDGFEIFQKSSEGKR